MPPDFAHEAAAGHVPEPKRAWSVSCAVVSLVPSREKAVPWAFSLPESATIRALPGHFHSLTPAPPTVARHEPSGDKIAFSSFLSPTENESSMFPEVRSQILTRPSSRPPVMIVLPSEVNRATTASPLCASRSSWRWPVAISQSLSIPSSSTVAIVLPSGEKAAALTSVWAATIFRTSCQREVSQTRTVPSLPALASRSPRGENSTE